MDGKLKGSYTVEMALLSSIWLLVVFASLLLILGSFGRVWDTAASAEAALYGSFSGVCQEGKEIQKAKERVQEKQRTDLLVSGTQEAVSVSFEQTLRIPFADLSWTRKGKITSKIIQPVCFLEKVQQARAFLEILRE